MYHVDNSTGVPVMPQPSPVTSETELFFTEGGNGVPPTFPGPDWFNIIQSELINILRAAGLDPDKMDNTQILAALKKLFLSRSNPFGDIKADGAAAIATALSNLGLDRFVQTKGNPNMRLVLDDASWYVYDSVLKKNIALAVNMGGTGALDAAGARTNLGLGNSATKNTGTTQGTVAAGDDSRITGALQKTGGDVTGALRRVGSYPNILLTDSTMDDATIGKTVGIEQSKGRLTFYLRSGDGSSSSGQVLFNMPDITGSKTLITKEECDVRYQQQTRLGAESRYGANDNYIAVPAGCVMTGLDVGGGPSSETFIGYRPLQVNINDRWATVNQL
ncbi:MULTISPECIES: phage tail protein [Citrobacter freundii complex]|uniref:phage tail protein n=1 Tax=Citrobacter freundii complex TaxID=1344959 RepID=UPI001B8391E2|nr:phage tail protein [Citrobacter freundii]HDQ2773105.1 phage tail protein [Citrobacter freundii]